MKHFFFKFGSQIGHQNFGNAVGSKWLAFFFLALDLDSMLPQFKHYYRVSVEFKSLNLNYRLIMLYFFIF